MTKAQIFPATFIEDQGWTALARIENPSGSLITQATLSTITYQVYDATTERSSGATALTISSVVFDTLQGTSLSDSRWAIDSTGYNFRAELPASVFPSDGKDYRVEFKFTPTSGAAFYLLFEGECIALRGS